MSQTLTKGIARRIVRYRKLNGWSAQRLADNTDGLLSRATIASIESGRRANLRLDQFLAICLALRVPPVALLVDLERPFDVTELQFPGATASPLDLHAPNAAAARWLTGSDAILATPAARRVAEICDLIDAYLAARDAYEAGRAVHRLRPGTDAAQRAIPESGVEAARQRLEDAGVHAPPQEH